MSKRVLQAIAIAIAAFTASPARAAPEVAAASARPSETAPPPEPARERRLALVLQAGLGAPLGFYGFAFELAPVPWWVLAVGVGRGNDGAQGAFTTRLRVPSVGLGVGVGVSTGSFAHRDNGQGAISLFGDHPSTEWRWKQAWWLNFEPISIEASSTSVVRERLFAGVAFLLNRESASCVQGRSAFTGGAGPPCSEALTRLFYVGIELGPGFALW